MPGFKRLKRLKPLKPSNSLAAASTSNCCTASSRQLPPSPLAGSLCCSRVAACPLPAHPSRQLPPSPLAVSLCCSRVAACPLPAHSPLLFGHSSLPFARLQTLKTLKTLQLPRGSFHQALWPSAFAVPGLQPALFLHIPRGSFHQARGRQRSSIAACPLPAHSPLLLGHSSLPFARLQTLKTLKTLQLPRGSFQEALWPSAFAVPGLQPALCLHIPRGSFHQAPGRQRSSIAACPLPAHSPLLLRHSSLPFARLQTLKTLKTLQLPRGSFHLQLLHCFLAAAATKPSGRQPLLFQGCSLPFACTSLAAASTKPSGRQPLLFQGCSLPFACT